MKLYFLRRHELTDRTVSPYKTAEVEPDDLIDELLASGVAIVAGDKRPMPQSSAVAKSFEEIKRRRIACEAMIAEELNTIVFDQFQDYYLHAAPGRSRGDRVAAAICFMRDDAYPYCDHSAKVDRLWEAALLHMPPKTFDTHIELATVWGVDPKTKKKKKLGVRYLW